MRWTSEKIAVFGLVVALILSIIVGIWTNSGVELQTSLGAGLVGYIGRVIQEESRKDGSK